MKLNKIMNYSWVDEETLFSSFVNDYFKVYTLTKNNLYLFYEIK